MKINTVLYAWPGTYLKLLASWEDLDFDGAFTLSH